MIIKPKTYLITLLLFGLAYSSLADNPRYKTEFFNSDSTYSLKLNKRGKWIMRDSTNRVMYKIKDDWFASKTIEISDDGKSVVIINDFAGRTSIGNITALWIYKSGNFLKKYELSDLIVDSCNIQKSIGHIIWSFEDYGFSKNQKQYVLTTLEMKRINFDLNNGSIISRQIPPEFDNGVTIVYGVVTDIENHSQIQVIKNFNGEKTENQQFIFKTNYGGLGMSKMPCYLIILDGIDITPFKYRFAMLNGCE